MPDSVGAIARVWSARATPANVPLYLRHFTESVKPELAALPGFLGSTVLERTTGDGEIEIVVTTRWRSMDAIHAFAGEDVDAAVVEPAAQAVLVHFDQRVRHYTVVDV